MKKSGALIAVLVVVLGIVAVALVSSGVGVWNKLNQKFQTVEGAKSHYSAALNTCTEKIKGVWEMANQYMEHESETFRAVAEARSGYDAARDAFERSAAAGEDAEQLTKAGADVVRAAMAFRIQVEAYPELRAAETAQENMRNMEVSVNEIKTALDDWVVAIREYNTYRGSAWPSMLGGFMKKFPAQIKYYEGEIQKLDVDALNPEKQ